MLKNTNINVLWKIQECGYWFLNYVKQKTKSILLKAGLV